MAFSLILALLLGEAVLQGAYYFSQGRWLWQPAAYKAGYVSAVADPRQYSLTPGFADPAQNVSVDAHGFRRSPEASNLPAEASVVAMLGDSVPFGAGVGDTETYPYDVQQQLTKAGSSLRVVNAGVPSYNMAQAIQRFYQDVLPNYPNVKVVVLQAANDISLLTYFRDEWTPDKTWAQARFNESIEGNRQRQQPAWQRWLARSAWAYYLNLAFDQTRYRAQLFQDTAPENPYEAYNPDGMIRRVRDQLDWFLSDCAQRHIEVLLLPVDPFYYQLDPAAIETNATLPGWPKYLNVVEGWHLLIEAFNHTLEAAAQRHANATFLDTRQDLDKRNRAELYLDFMHYTPEGNQAVAGLIARRLLLAPGQ
ncbi:MAG: hypothetical protein KC476_03305 [Cyanobacteria bacterium HKST-UBA06]|nr:hypothetical protein [Cyanobacteria bacterium HKST-UBA06]